MTRLRKNSTTEIDRKQFRAVLGHYPTGVCVVTGCNASGAAAGLVVGSFTSVSLDPPLVAFFPDRRSTSWPQVRESGQFCVNILGEDQIDLCRRFASRRADKFRGVAHGSSQYGMPILEGAIAFIDCALEQEIDAGDHTMVLGMVRDLKVKRAAHPLLFCKGAYGRFEFTDQAIG